MYTKKIIYLYRIKYILLKKIIYQSFMAYNLILNYIYFNYIKKLFIKLY